MPSLALKTASLLLFSEGNFPLAFPASRVVSILEPAVYWQVPRPHPGAMGFFRFQGQLIPLLRMTDLLESPRGAINYYVVLESLGALAAAAVQNVDNLLNLDAECFEHPRDRDLPVPRRLVQAIAREPGQEDDIYVLSTPAIVQWLSGNSFNGGAQ